MKIFPLLISLALALHASARDFSVFQRGKLAAWCIVPFDTKKRGPVERAEMLNRLGITKLAYDWRDEHIPTFDAEVEAMQSHGIEISAWWLSNKVDDRTRKIFEVIGQHKIHPQLWVMCADPQAPDQTAKVKAAADELRPLAEEAAHLGCQLALYNHGGWFGEPENQLAIIGELKMPNVGMVYNFHHGHSHITDFPELFAKMQPHLLALNLNGMVADGETTGRKIIPIGSGDQESKMIEIITDSGWKGQAGILCHLNEDAEVVLRGNLEGLEGVIRKLDPPGR